MKISEAMKILESRLKEYGDIKIEVWDDMGEHEPIFEKAKSEDVIYC